MNFRHYLDFINHFVKLYNEKRSELEEQQLHLNVGLGKIAETVEQVEQMQKSLAIKNQELQVYFITSYFPHSYLLILTSKMFLGQAFLYTVHTFYFRMSQLHVSVALVLPFHTISVTILIISAINQDPLQYFAPIYATNGFFYSDIEVFSRFHFSDSSSSPGNEFSQPSNL